jgi:hypothetical protein
MSERDNREDFCLLYIMIDVLSKLVEEKIKYGVSINPIRDQIVENRPAPARSDPHATSAMIHDAPRLDVSERISRTVALS